MTSKWPTHTDVMKRTSTESSLQTEGESSCFSASHTLESICTKDL